MYDKDYLMHYGVLGMKWGVRRDRKTLNKSRKEKKKMSDDAIEARKLSKKKVSEMSNAELRKLNDRVNLEQNYNRLHPSKIKKGIAFLGAAAGATTTLINLYNNGDKLIKLGRQFAGQK